MMTADDLPSLRQKIDDIDQQIQALLVERAHVALEVGEIKKSNHDEPVFYRPEREAAILSNVMARDCGPLEPKAMAQIFRTIMSANLAVQQPIDVAYLGPEGTFSQAAALKQFGHSIQQQPQKTIADVFKSVAHGRANYGVVPVENSIGGIINDTLEALVKTPLTLCGEVTIPIQQNFLVAAGDESAIKKIYSHEQSLAQCRDWLDEHYPRAKRIAVASNGQAALMARQEAGAAAIASLDCAELYHLHVAATNVQGKNDNATRFLVIGQQQLEASQNDRTTLLVTVKDDTGALEHIIQPFAKHKVNITFIKSRPAPNQAGHYVFVLDVDGHRDNSDFKACLKDLVEITDNIKVLGSYPKAVI
ncbi:MAG: prephenate dehydratase [Legionellales bacterium]|nr:prephenate dehydratase [Legionellales bacterium]|tara:strand:- start:1806 stop:2891 length:1086 start_codon:yes stop_codon:yes gene_type:complete